MSSASTTRTSPPRPRTMPSSHSPPRTIHRPTPHSSQQCPSNTSLRSASSSPPEHRQTHRSRSIDTCAKKRHRLRHTTKASVSKSLDAFGICIMNVRLRSTCTPYFGVSCPVQPITSSVTLSFRSSFDITRGRCGCKRAAGSTIS
ncbi:hypothetical protein BV22DRAFT_898376 [Leucogyrophana mollusca]|uniref:Uncharacterized protein n=1 Tax=Leucogyrophana mollusca TaxID=85980 RepID=A0ACB8AZ19_9AGAM|nr:hypothetical protein BV22DRAFT_898376 [Leucogyrophana mollusca]